jgi:hypothetical protein
MQDETAAATAAATAATNGNSGGNSGGGQQQRRKTGLAGRPDIYIGRKTLHLHVN